MNDLLFVSPLSRRWGGGWERGAGGVRAQRRRGDPFFASRRRAFSEPFLYNPPPKRQLHDFKGACMSRTAVLCLLLALCAAGAAVAIPADEAFRGGESLTLRGLFVAADVETSLELINLAPAANRCTVALTAADGSRLAPVISLTLKALERRPVADVFEGLTDPYVLTAGQASVSCAGDFSAIAQVTDRASNWTDRIAPQMADTPLALPDVAVDCPVAAACFDAPGLVHVPEPPPGAPVGRVAFPAPAGVVKRLRLSLDVTVADWYAKEPNGKHLIYWFVIDKNLDMPGMLYFRGPGKNEAFARHGIGLKHPQKIKVIKPFAAQIGHTYHVDNDYDMGRRVYTVTISDKETGQVKVVLTSKPNVASYTIKPRAKFLVDMGFPPDLVPTEVPSYKWQYSDVHVEAYR